MISMLRNRVEIAKDLVLYTLELPSRRNSLTLVENFVDTIKEQYNIPDETYAKILTCVSEVSNNSILHGNKEDDQKQVRITLEIQNNKNFVFTISDEGGGFDYHNLPDPTSPENIEQLTGRGIFIVKQLADRCVFNSNGSEVALHFNI
jgi:serine/threonine-protein kinase RsbW